MTKTPTIPEDLRDWNTPWPDYNPVDVGRLWGADDEPDNPRDIDWNVRRNYAVIPYQLDADGLPLNPNGRTGCTGLGDHLYWGENQCADMITIAPSDTDPIGDVAVIQRSDRGTWALPGGHVDPGEGFATAAVRELREETTLITSKHPRLVTYLLVPDPRQTDRAWRVTALFLVWLDDRPELVGMDDAKDAAWVPFNNLADKLDAAHLPLIDAARAVL